MLVINFNGRKPAQQDYKFSVVGNAKVDTIRFTLQSDLDDYDDVYSLSNVSAYVKVQSAGKEYIDKIRVNSTYQNDVLNVDLELAKKTTQYRNLAFQLQFEQDNGEIVSQTDIVYVSLSGNINADEEIPDKYPSELQRIEGELDNHEERIEKLEEDSGGVKEIVMGLTTNDKLEADLLDKDGEIISSSSLILPYVRKEQGKGLSTNDFTNALKERLLNNITHIGTINAGNAYEQVVEQILQGDDINYLTNSRKFFTCEIYNSGKFDGINIIGVLYDDNFIDLYLLSERKIVSIHAIDETDPFYDAYIDRDEVLPTKEYVDLIEQNLREIIAGKTMSYTISYQTVAPTQATFVANKYKRKDGTKIATWNDFETYVDTDICGNSFFNSQSSSINLADQYIITTDNLVIRRDDLINGDNIYVVELDVPDRWFDAYGDDAYILETAKVDISSKVDKTDSTNKLYGTDANGDQTTYNVAVGTTNNAVVQRNGSGQIKVPQTPSADDDSASKVYVDNKQNIIAPNYDATSTYVLGAKVIYNGKLYKCTTPITQAEAWDSTHWAEITVSSGFASIEQGLNVINASDIASNRVLTDSQISLITNGKQTEIRGTFPSYNYTKISILTCINDTNANVYTGLCITEGGDVAFASRLYAYTINKSTKVFAINFTFRIDMSNAHLILAGLLEVNGKNIPSYPNNPTVPQVLKYLTDNTMAWGNQSAFEEIPAPSSTTLTDDEYNLIVKGVKINGTFLNLRNPTLFPTYDGGGYLYGLIVGQTATGWQSLETQIKQYKLNKTTKSIVIQDNDTRIGLYQINGINGKTIDYYQNNVYHYATLSGTELKYEEINDISISVNTTFTLATAPNNTYPEYKANITNTNTSNAITITLTGVSKVKTNDSNITIVEGTNSTFTIPADTTIELNIQNGHAIVFNWEA